MGRCAGDGQPALLISLAPGAYRAPERTTLEHFVSIVGTGPEECTLLGTVEGLRSGTFLRDVTVMAGRRAGVVVTRDESPEITGCRIRENNGGGLVCHSGASPQVRDFQISENFADEGSAILLNRGSSAEIRNCVIRENQSELFGGAVLCSGSSSRLVHCTMTENFNGGVRAIRGSALEVGGCILWDNLGESLRVEDSAQPDVHHSCVDSSVVWPGVGNINVSPGFCGWGFGPDIFVDENAEEGGDGAPDSPFRAPDSPFRDLDEALDVLSFGLGLSDESPCVAAGPDGGNMGADLGVCVEDSLAVLRIHLAQGDYESASATRLAHGVSIEGAGLFETFVRGPVVGLRTGQSLKSLTVAGSDRGGVYVTVGEAPSIESCTITRNLANDGGGIYCDVGASPVIRHCAIVGNFATRGGGLYCARDASPILTQCRLQGNRAESSGGAVRVEFASATLEQCQVHGNEADRGAALYASGSSVWLRNVTVLGNITDLGAALLNRSSCVELDFCTVAENVCEEGVLFTEIEDLLPPAEPSCAAVQVRRSIVWGNTGITVGGALEEPPRVGHSMFEETTLLIDEGGNVRGSPNFVARGVFVREFRPVEIAGETVFVPDFVLDPGDYHLVSGSPGIDSARSESAPDRDLAGAARPCGGGFQIGAYESGACVASLSFRRGDVDGSGAVDLSDSVVSLMFQFAGAIAPGCLDAMDVDDDGRIGATDALFALVFLFRPVQAIPSPGPYDCGPDTSPDGLGCELSPCSL